VLFGFDRVGVYRDGRWILWEVTAFVPGRGVTVLVGASGSGKTSLLRLCNCLEVPDSGEITFRGLPLSGVEVLAHRRQVGMVFQQPVLFGGTVRDNLLVARPDAGETELRAAVTDVGLTGSVLDARAGSLSTGEAQRTCLARTLIIHPAVLLLDEPTSALDPDNRLAFEHVVLDLVRGAGSARHEAVPTLWVTHDHDQLRRIADHVVALDSGRLVYAGPPDGLPSAAGHPPAPQEGPPGDRQHDHEWQPVRDRRLDGAQGDRER
jgi:putative ABC transport system ATP-binding protein